MSKLKSKKINIKTTKFTLYLKMQKNEQNQNSHKNQPKHIHRENGIVKNHVMPLYLIF